MALIAIRQDSLPLEVIWIYAHKYRIIFLNLLFMPLLAIE